MNWILIKLLTYKIMKTYKLDGLEYYTVAFSKKDAVFRFLMNKIGVTENNLIEVNIEPNRDGLGRIFKNLNDLITFNVEI